MDVWGADTTETRAAGQFEMTHRRPKGRKVWMPSISRQLSVEKSERKPAIETNTGGLGILEAIPKVEAGRHPN